MLTNYAIIENGVVVQYPVNPRVWVIATDSYNVHELWQGGELDGKTYVFCHNPMIDILPTQSLVEKTPACDPNTGLWMRQYDIVPATDDEIAERRPLYLRGALDFVAERLDDYAKKQSMILELPEAEQAKWEAYRIALQTLPDQPGYPFTYTLPKSPEITTTVNIGVERV